LVTQRFLPHHSITASKQAKATEVNKCSFLKLKSTLKGRGFDTFDEIQKNLTKKLFAITNEAFQKAFQSWQKCWERCVASEGNHFEGNKLE
jgi:hypothetical protein